MNSQIKITSTMTEMEKLKLKHEALSEELLECENRSVRLVKLSNGIQEEIEENKKAKLKIEIAIQANYEHIQQLNLS